MIDIHACCSVVLTNFFLASTILQCISILCQRENKKEIDAPFAYLIVPRGKKIKICCLGVCRRMNIKVYKYTVVDVVVSLLN